MKKFLHKFRYLYISVEEIDVQRREFYSKNKSKVLLAERFTAALLAWGARRRKRLGSEAWMVGEILHPGTHFLKLS
jgi:hypothetical protein